MQRQRFMYVGSEAIDVDVQLVLRPSDCRINRKAYPVARQLMPYPLIDKVSGAPCCSEIVGCAGPEDRCAFDASDPLGGNQKKLCWAINILEYRVPVVFSAVQINQRAWRGVAMLLLVRNTLVMHDLPEYVRIGARHADATTRERTDGRGHEDHPG
jgi:hypothetical protein